MALRLALGTGFFASPEIRMSGIDDEMSINDLICSTQQDGRLVKIVGQVLEMGDARKRAIKIAWKCKVDNCGGLVNTFPISLKIQKSNPTTVHIVVQVCKGTPEPHGFKTVHRIHRSLLSND